MLLAGVLVGPLFVGLSLILALTSPGFDITKHEVSLLLIGPFGWLQMVNFVSVGLLSIICALGLKRTITTGRASKWSPILLVCFGLLFIIAGFFHPDPQLGFPAGATIGVPVSAGINANVHSLAFMLLAIATIVNGVVFARRYFFTKQRAWAIYSVLNSVAILLFVMLGGMLMNSGQGGLPLMGAAVTISFWVSMVAVRTLRDLNDKNK